MYPKKSALMIACAFRLPLLVVSLGLSHTNAAAGSSAVRGYHSESSILQAVAGDQPPTILQQKNHLRMSKKYPPSPSMQGFLLADWEPCEFSSHCSSGCCSSEYSKNDGQLLQCIPFHGGFRSDLCVGQSSSITPLFTSVTTGTCGNGQIGNGICADGTCCSDSGWCGTTSEVHCDSRGLQSNSSSSSTIMGTCGNGFRGNGICANGGCCSQLGWCEANIFSDCPFMENTNFTGGTAGNGTDSTLLEIGEWCTEDFECMSGSCCFVDRTRNGPVFQCSSNTMCDDGKHDGDRDDGGHKSDRDRFDSRDQAEFTGRNQPPPNNLTLYYTVGFGVFVAFLLLIIIFLLLSKKRGASRGSGKADPTAEKPSGRGYNVANNVNRSMTRPTIEVQSSSREPTLPNTITISSSYRVMREPTRKGQLVYPVVDPSISDQSSSYTNPSLFPGETTPSLPQRSIMSEPCSDMDEHSDA